MNVRAVEDVVTTQESTRVQLSHLNDAIASLTGKVDMLLDMTKTVAVMQVEADNHRSYTQQMELRVNTAVTKLETNLEAEEANRVHANKNIHERIDVVRKWMFTVGGGGLVVIAMLGYVGESLRGFAATYVESHDAAIRQKHELDTLKQRVDDLYKQKAPPP